MSIEKRWNSQKKKETPPLPAMRPASPACSDRTPSRNCIATTAFAPWPELDGPILWAAWLDLSLSYCPYNGRRPALTVLYFFLHFLLVDDK
jgi:hypothetical protein